MSVGEPAGFFVYGTLKRGESNYGLLRPYVAQSFSATVFGDLYDCGPWPALVAGNGTVEGELVRVPSALMGEVVVALDGLEGYDPSDERWSPYVRRAVECRLADGGTELAFVYFYNGKVEGLRYLPGGRWPDGRAEGGRGDER
jgi:gamma-glutamylcyclotransferase (GGCT)/AIG2-like uncharacterized protein YtfP